MKNVRKLLYFGSLAVIVVTVCFLGYYYYARAHETDVYAQMQYALSTAATPLPQTAPPTAEPTPEPHPCPVDFTALQQSCADIYAWIEIPGMEVSYPVVQHPDNDAFYLKHDIEGKYNDHGAIYSEPSVNTKDFSDYHTILYGHNFEDGTLFSPLTGYRDAALLDENDTVYIYTPEKELRYRIFAAITYSNGYIPYYFDDTVPEDRQAFLVSLPDTVRELSNHILEDVTVTDEDRLLILSTCTGRSDSVIHRYLVVATLEEERPWDTVNAG